MSGNVQLILVAHRLAVPLFYVCWRVGLVRMQREEGEGQTSLKPPSKHEEKAPIMFTSTGEECPLLVSWRNLCRILRVI